MQPKNNDVNPCYYKSVGEMDKPLSELMEELRRDIGIVRGKLSDIKRSYGWDERIEHIEGGLTCMLVAMYATMQEWKNFESRQLAKAEQSSNINS